VMNLMQALALNQSLFEPRTGGVVSRKPLPGEVKGNNRAVFLVGAVADPTRHSVFKVTVGRATVPANTRRLRMDASSENPSALCNPE
jgi:hypothetical protein